MPCSDNTTAPWLQMPSKSLLLSACLIWKPSTLAAEPEEYSHSHWYILSHSAGELCYLLPLPEHFFGSWPSFSPRIPWFLAFCYSALLHLHTCILSEWPAPSSFESSATDDALWLPLNIIDLLNFFVFNHYSLLSTSCGPGTVLGAFHVVLI